MNESINIKSEKLMRNIVSLVNNSNLPISNVYFIFKSIMQNIENTYYGVLNKESQECITETDGNEILNKDDIEALKNISIDIENKEDNNN